MGGAVGGASEECVYKGPAHWESAIRIIMASLCVIIVNDFFETDKVSNRPGAWDDAMKLRQVLKEHGDFEFEVHRNVEALYMMDLIEDGECGGKVMLFRVSLLSPFSHSQ